MLPGMRGMNPKAMQAMMKQMGLQTEEIPAKKVVIEQENGKKIVIEPAQVTSMTMQGQKTFTVMGKEREEAGTPEIPHEDVKMVAEQTQASEEDAKKALEENDGDIAAAITALKK